MVRMVGIRKNYIRKGEKIMNKELYTDVGKEYVFANLHRNTRYIPRSEGYTAILIELNNSNLFFHHVIVELFAIKAQRLFPNHPNIYVNWDRLLIVFPNNKYISDFVETNDLKALTEYFLEKFLTISSATIKNISIFTLTTENKNSYLDWFIKDATHVFWSSLEHIFDDSCIDFLKENINPLNIRKLICL